MRERKHVPDEDFEALATLPPEERNRELLARGDELDEEGGVPYRSWRGKETKGLFELL